MTSASQTESAAFRINQAEFPVYTNYLPLEAGHIRLLTVARDKGSPAKLYGKLTHHDLVGGVPGPEYHALSYYWGPPGSTKVLVVDGEEIQLRKSLWTFLDTLCRNIAGSTLTVWLDVLCINQKDTAERNAQVEMMGHIYRQALDVLAWVGEGTADSDFGLSYLATIDSTEQAIADHHSQSSLSQLALAGLQDLFLRPYWTRVWIVQEAVVNSDFHVYCGDYRAEWNRLVKGMRDLRASQHSAKPLFEDETVGATIPFSQRSNLAWTYMRVIEQARSNNLMVRQVPKVTKHLSPKQLIGGVLDLVLLFAQQECLEVRDKVYGFRGLAVNANTIKVDYSCRPLDLMVQVLSSQPISSANIRGTAQRFSDFLHLTQLDLEQGLSDLPDDCLRCAVEFLPTDHTTSINGMAWPALYGGNLWTGQSPRWTRNLALMRKQRMVFPGKVVRSYFKWFKDGTYGEYADPVFYLYTKPDGLADPHGTIFHAGFFHEYWKSKCDTTKDFDVNRQTIDTGDAKLLSMLSQAEELCMILQHGARMCRIRPDASGRQNIHLSRWALFALLSLQPKRQSSVPDLLSEHAERHPNISDAVRCECSQDDTIMQGKSPDSSYNTDLDVGAGTASSIRQA